MLSISDAYLDAGTAMLHGYGKVVNIGAMHADCRQDLKLVDDNTARLGSNMLFKEPFYLVTFS